MSELDSLFDSMKQAHFKDLESKKKESLSLNNEEDNSLLKNSVVKDMKTYKALKFNMLQYSKIEEGDENVDSSDNENNTINPNYVQEIPLIQNKLSKKQSKITREVTSGGKWFNMPKGNAEDPKFKKDLMIIQQRAVLDPKRHYKKDKWKVPKYFQVGTIVEDKSEFYSARLKNKERKQTLLQEVLHDKDSTKYFKKKYSEIQEQKSKFIRYKSKKVFKRR